MRACSSPRTSCIWCSSTRPAVWAIVRREDGRLMGSVGLTTDSARTYGSSRSLGYALGVHYWGQGYMTEAVRAVIRLRL